METEALKKEIEIVLGLNHKEELGSPEAREKTVCALREASHRSQFRFR